MCPAKACRARCSWRVREHTARPGPAFRSPAALLGNLNAVLYPQLGRSHMNTAMLYSIFEPGAAAAPGVLRVSNAG